MEQMKLLKRKKFGSSSVKASDEVMEQLSLYFDEAETSVYTERKAETQDVIPKDIPVEEIIHELLCTRCGEEIIVISKEVHETLMTKPAEAVFCAFTRDKLPTGAFYVTMKAEKDNYTRGKHNEKATP